ncbi:MAG: hypothetical protein AB7I32_01070 [Gammaproteobacteria bacterium]
MSYMTDRNSYRAAPLRTAGEYIPFSTRDLDAAMPDIFSALIGLNRAENLIAADLMTTGVKFDRIVRHRLAGLLPDEEVRSAPVQALMSRALGVQDFALANAIVSGLAEPATAAFDLAVSGILRTMRRIPRPNFLPTSISNISTGDVAKRPEFAEWAPAEVAATGVVETVGVETWGHMVQITREALLNSAFTEMAMVFASMGNSAGKAISAEFARVLEDTTTLADGRAFFNSTDDNVLTSSGAPSVSTFDAACTKLARQVTAAGSIAGCTPRYLICPPEYTGTAKVLAAAIYDPSGSPGTLPQAGLDIVVVPHLSSSSTWYLMADPIAAPTIGLLTLGASPESRTFSMERRPTPPDRDGIMVAVRNEFRVTRLSRVGIVKVTV